MQDKFFLAFLTNIGLLENKRTTGIEPVFPAWKASDLPLIYIRERFIIGWDPA